MRGVRSVHEPTARSQSSLPALDRIMIFCRCGGHGRWPRKELGRHSPRNAGHPHAACMPRAASSQRQARGRGGAPRVGLVGQLDGHDGGVLVVDHAVDRVLAQQDELDVFLEGLRRAGGRPSGPPCLDAHDQAVSRRRQGVRRQPRTGEAAPFLPCPCPPRPHANPAPLPAWHGARTAFQQPWTCAQAEGLCTLGRARAPR